MKTKKLISFHGEQRIKDKYIERLEQHYKHDEIVKGEYWEGGKGCAVGCTVHSPAHDSYDTELGITWRLAILEDGLFEKLPNEQAKELPLQFIRLMPVGVDTNIIFKKFMIWNLTDNKEGLANIVKDVDYAKLLKEIGITYKLSLKKEIAESVWLDLSKRASASAYTYAYAYASTYAYASSSASTYASAYASAYTYAYAYADYDTKYTERILRMRDKLLQLIKDAK